MFSKKATKIDQIFIVDLTLTTRCQIDGEGFINFCGLLRKHELQKTFCYQTLFWPFTFRINCSSYLKIFANSRPSASNFKSFSQSLEQYFDPVGQNKFCNKIPYLRFSRLSLNYWPFQQVRQFSTGFLWFWHYYHFVQQLLKRL